MCEYKNNVTKGQPWIYEVGDSKSSNDVYTTVYFTSAMNRYNMGNCDYFKRFVKVAADDNPDMEITISEDYDFSTGEFINQTQVSRAKTILNLS